MIDPFVFPLLIQQNSRFGFNMALNKSKAKNYVHTLMDGGGKLGILCDKDFVVWINSQELSTLLF